jgi:branched-chain amino acid aminotransferase
MPNKTYPYSYIRNKICKSKDATISIQCKAIQYGQGCFSGIRINWNPAHKQLYVFRLEDHYKRIKNSANILGMRFNYSYKKFEDIIIQLIKKNKIRENSYIRPTLYSASTKLTPRFDNPDDDLAIYMISLKDYFDASSGVKTCISSYRRIDDDTLSVKAKSTGGYIPSAVAKTDALRNGYQEPIFLNRTGMVCEASGANIFMVKDGEIWTPPTAANILNGITRRSLIEIAEREMGQKVREENIDRSTLLSADEVFLCGTAARVSYVSSIDQRKISTGKIGRQTKKLKELVTKASLGDLPGYEKWLTPIY